MPELASKTQQIASTRPKVNLWTKKNKLPWKATKTSFKWNKHRGDKLESEEVVEAGPSFEGTHGLHPPVQIRQDERKGSGLRGQKNMKGSWPRDGGFIIHIKGALQPRSCFLIGKVKYSQHVTTSADDILWGRRDRKPRSFSCFCDLWPKIKVFALILVCAFVSLIKPFKWGSQFWMVMSLTPSVWFL